MSVVAFLIVSSGIEISNIRLYSNTRHCITLSKLSVFFTVKINKSISRDQACAFCSILPLTADPQQPVGAGRPVPGPLLGAGGGRTLGIQTVNLLDTSLFH